VQIVDVDGRETLAGGIGREIGRTGVARKAHGSKSAVAGAGEAKQRGHAAEEAVLVEIAPQQGEIAFVCLD
jgi:hypothetical protein